MDDYISREAVNDLIEDVRNNHFILMSERVNLVLLKSKVAEIPAADVQPVKHTKNLSTFAFCDEFICENCGIHLAEWIKLDVEDYEEYKYKFCPECGAKVKDGDTNDSNDK